MPHLTCNRCNRSTLSPIYPVRTAYLPTAYRLPPPSRRLLPRQIIIPVDSLRPALLLDRLARIVPGIVARVFHPHVLLLRDDVFLEAAIRCANRCGGRPLAGARSAI